MCPVVGFCANCIFLPLKRRRMKRVVLFVSVLIAVTIADDKNLEHVAEGYNVDVQALKACLDEAELSPEEMLNLYRKFGEIGDITKEVKQSFVKYNKFLSCTLEKNGMMVDSKLVVDKILKALEKDNENSSKEILTECINSLNENSQMTKEDRAFGLMLCVIKDYKERK